MRIIAVANQKGGCGKTTTAINLSAGLSFLGKKTLLVDLDPQGHSTLGLGFDMENFEKSLYDVLSPLQNQTSLEEVIIPVNSNHHLVPSQVILSAIEQQLSGVYGREEKLLEKLTTIKDQYDFIIIDCPPNLGLLTFNALRAADELLIPVEPSCFSIQGLKKIKETIVLIEETLKHRVRVHALLTMFNGRSNFGQKIFSELQQLFQSQLLNTVIHQNIRLREAAQMGKSICDFDRKSTGFKDYLSLSSELIEKGAAEDLNKPIAAEDNQNYSENVAQPVPESRAQYEDGFDVPISDPEIHIEETITSAEILENSASVTSCDSHEKADVELKKFPMVLTDGVILGFVNGKAKLVQVAGDFNNWVNETLENTGHKEGLWEKFIPLSPGRYRYKFIVDGEWTVDPQNAISEPNPYGGIDSVILVKDINRAILNERFSKV